MMRRLRLGQVRGLLYGVVAALFYVGFAPGQTLACDGHGHCQPSCPRWVPPPPTELEAGPDSDDLKIHVVGPYFDTIEVYFRTELFYRETFPRTSYLQYGNWISIARKNKFGTFAVLHDGGSLVKVYGWKTNQQKPESLDIPVQPGCQVMMQWVTDRIFKVRYGPNLSKSTIVRFNDADKSWTELYKN